MHEPFSIIWLHKKKSFDEGARKSNAIFYCAIEKVIIQFVYGSGFKAIDDGNVEGLRRIGKMSGHFRMPFHLSET